MVRLLFAHTSVYTVLLLADTRRRADAVHADYRRSRAALGADEPPAPPRALPPIRLMSWDASAVPPPDECPEDEVCASWTYVRPGVQGPKAHCWLKNPVARPVTDANTISGVKFKPRSVRIDP